MKPWLKAGLIGAVVSVVLQLVGLVPALNCITGIAVFFVYFAVGVLAAYWMPPIRMAGPAAGQGALAGLLTSVASGLTSMIVTAGRMATIDSAEFLSQLPPGSLQQLTEAGIDPAMFTGPGAGLLYGSMCCGGTIVAGVLLAVVGAALFAAIKPE